MKIFITTIIAVPALVIGGILLFLSSLSMEKLIICTSVDEAYHIPSKICSYYLYNYSNNKDLTSLKERAGLAYVFNIEDKELKYEIIAYLILRGVNVNEISSADGLTPLNSAILLNDPELVTFLLDKGAIIKNQDKINKLNAIEYNLFLQKNSRNIDRSKISNILNEYRQ